MENEVKVRKSILKKKSSPLADMSLPQLEAFKSSTSNDFYPQANELIKMNNSAYDELNGR